LWAKNRNAEEKKISINKQENKSKHRKDCIVTGQKKGTEKGK
jgi:ribosomal protein S14